MKKTFIALITLVAITTFAKSIYIVSGGDLRQCDAYWTVVTTVNNESVKAIPELHMSSNTSSASIKIDKDTEYLIGGEKLPIDKDKKIVQPTDIVFPIAGVHTLKLYDRNLEVTQIEFVGENGQDGPSFKTIKLPNWQKSISSNWAFGRYQYLDTIIIPEGLLSLSYGSFYACYGLKKVVLPNSIRDVNNAFSNCTSLEEINIPESVTSITRNFCNGAKLSSIELPIGITNISGNAFGYCGQLKTLTILNKNIEIASNGFYLCNAINTINYSGTLEEWNNNPHLVSRFGTATQTANNIANIPSDGVQWAKQLNFNFVK